jgi:hypothetical protein
MRCLELDVLGSAMESTHPISRSPRHFLVVIARPIRAVSRSGPDSAIDCLTSLTVEVADSYEWPHVPHRGLNFDQQFTWDFNPFAL